MQTCITKSGFTYYGTIVKDSEFSIGKDKTFTGVPKTTEGFHVIDSYCKKSSLYKVIQAIHPNTTQFDTYIERSSNYHLLEGTIIATSQRGMFAPVSYDEIFRSNCLYLGFDFKDSKFFNFFSKFIEKYKNTYFEHLTIRSTICDKYNPDE